MSAYKVSLDSAVITNPDDYVTFNDFFTRALKPSARPIAPGEDQIASPADGFVSQSGPISKGLIVQAKGRNFSLQELLGQKPDVAFTNGQFITVYLSPSDYHRVHMPLTGTLLRTQYVPGRLFSVNTKSVEHIPNLFARNERLVCYFNTEVGEVVVVMVGAMLVAGIETVWGGKEIPDQQRAMVSKEYADKNIVLKKGEEMGRFQFGSTVIVLFPSDVQLTPLTELQPIKMGEMIGQILQTKVH